MRAEPAAAHARVTTARAQRYLEQFCRHAEQVHRIGRHAGPPVAVRRDGHRATLDFAGARCVLEARADALVVRVEADDAGTLHRIQALIAADLTRFAGREQPAVTWQPDGR